jgi:hypothetical protein
MPWGVDAAEIATIRREHPNIAEIRRLRSPRGRGLLFGYLMPMASTTPVLRNMTPIWIMLAPFRGR